MHTRGGGNNSGESVCLTECVELCMSFKERQGTLVSPLTAFDGEPLCIDEFSSVFMEK